MCSHGVHRDVAVIPRYIRCDTRLVTDFLAGERCQLVPCVVRTFARVMTQKKHDLPQAITSSRATSEACLLRHLSYQLPPDRTLRHDIQQHSRIDKDLVHSMRCEPVSLPLLRPHLFMSASRTTERCSGGLLPSALCNASASKYCMPVASFRQQNHSEDRSQVVALFYLDGSMFIEG